MAYADAIAYQIFTKKAYCTRVNKPTNLPALASIATEGTPQVIDISSVSPSNVLTVTEASVETGATVAVPLYALVLPERIRALHPQFSHSYLAKDQRLSRKDCRLNGCNSKSMVYCWTCNKTYCLDKVGATTSTTTKCCFYAHICREYAKDLMADDPFHAQFARWNDCRLTKTFV